MSILGSAILLLLAESAPSVLSSVDYLVITGGGAGALTITGLPFAKTSGPYPIGQVLFDGVDWTAGANLCCTFGTVSVGSTIFFEQTNDDAGASAVQITGVSANDYIFFTISYWA